MDTPTIYIVGKPPHCLTRDLFDPPIIALETSG